MTRNLFLKVQKRRSAAEHEYNILKRLTGKYKCRQHVLCAFDYKYDEDKKEALIAMQYVQGKTLFDIFQKCGTFDDNQKMRKQGCPDYLKIFLEIAKAVKVFHDNGIAHLDLKPENILITKNYNPVIIDFGLSCFERDINTVNKKGKKIEISLKDRCNPKYYGGTGGYLAPEVGHSSVKNFEKVDIFALGVIFFILMIGGFPYNDDFKTNYLYLLQDLDINIKYANLLKELIFYMLDKNRKTREPNNIDYVVKILTKIYDANNPKEVK